jgi:putative phage-type endonuclease
MKIKSKVRFLMNIEQPEQRSQAWFDMRKGKITASSAASLLIKDEMTTRDFVNEFDLDDSFIDGRCANPYSSKKEYILSKCGHREFSGSVATYWGTMLEQVATDVYCRREKRKIIEFGLLPHPTIDYIGASPDGISPEGVMLEIKCPYRRKITGVPPFYYWIQMQLQLEVANLTKCDFLECEFVEIKNRESYDNVELHEGEEKGLFIEMRPLDLYNREKSEYFYPPAHMSYGDELDAWCEKKLNVINKNNKGGYKIFPVYWKIITYSVIRVRRNKEWFNCVLPVLTDAWKQILYYRDNGCESDGPLGVLLFPKKQLNTIVFDDIDAGKHKINAYNDIDHNDMMILSDSDDET